MANQLTRYATVATVDTAGLGGFYTPNIHEAAVSGEGSVLSVNNQIKVNQIVLPFRAVVGQFVFRVTTVSASGLCAVGLYDKDKNLIVRSGAISTTGAGIKNGNTNVTVTLEPGVYFTTWTGDNTTFRLRAAGTPDSGIPNVNGVDRVGNAANPSVAAILPATLGALTAGTHAPIVVFYEP